MDSDLDYSVIDSPLPASVGAKFEDEERESVVEILKEIIRDASRSKKSANGRPASRLQTYRDVISEKAPRLNKSITDASTDLLEWVNRGGKWRAFFILTTGTISMVGLSGLFLFLLFLITATVSITIVALLGSAAVVGVGVGLFFMALTGVYIGALAVGICIISTIAFFTAVAVLVVSGWIAFWWVVWVSARKVLQVGRGSLAFTASTLNNVSARTGPADKKLE